MPAQTAATTERPAFLTCRRYETGRELIIAFEETSFANRVAVDKWLLWASVYGSMTWQEQCLFRAIENEEVDAAIAASQVSA